MVNFPEWIEQNNDGETIVRRMQRGVAYERKAQCDLAVESRKTLRNFLRCEKIKQGGQGKHTS